MPVASLLVAPWLLAPFIMRAASGNGPRFDPIAPDEIDAFSFDYAREIGAAAILDAAVICSVIGGIDLDPGSRVLSAPQINGPLVTAILGEMVAEVLYRVEALVSLTDGRILAMSAQLACQN